jgi:imidazolonepropionase-like amidohydrolase
MSSVQYETTVFHNVRVSDGHCPMLSPHCDVLIRDTTIESILKQSIPKTRDERRLEIEGDGRVLMPGMIDAHWHAMLASTPLSTALTADLGYLNR